MHAPWLWRGRAPHPEQCRRVAAQTHAAFGRIDVLINNAFSAAPVVRFAEGEVDDWRQAMEVNLANELGPAGIRVNSIVIGPTDNPNYRAYCAREGARRGVDPQVVADEMAAANALRFIPSSEDVARGVVFFASELGRAATAQFLLIDAGSQVQ